MILISQDHLGLLVQPVDEIATIFPEHLGRHRVVDSQGRVSYLPTSPPDGPWRPFHHGWANARHLTLTREGLRDPGQFLYPPQDLEIPKAIWKPDPDKVVSLIGHGQNCHWHTDDGDLPQGITAAKASARHPHLFKMRNGVYLNKLRLQRIIKVNRRTVSPFDFEMDTGEVYRLNGAFEAIVAERLGLPNLDRLPPYREEFWRRDLRDFPYEIAMAPAERLRKDFSSPDELLANIAYQVFLWRRQGRAIHFGTSYRDALYDPNLPTAYRAGFLDTGQSPTRKGALPESELFDLWQRILLEMVNQDRLFTYTDIGFLDEYAENRQIGSKLPQVILLAEKETQGRMVQQLAQEFGFTSYVTRGVSTLVSDEFLAAALKKVTKAPIRIIAVVDHDPGGRLIARTLANHLSSYDLVVQEPEHLMGPHLFSPEEIARLALPCTARNASQATKVKQWLNDGGGINGLPLLLHVNHLRPYSRLRDALVAHLKKDETTP